MFVLGDCADGPRHPAFGRNQATTEQFYKGCARAHGYGCEEMGNPTRQAMTGSLSVGQGTPNEDKKLLIGRRPAHSKSIRVQGGDHANRFFCQVFSSHFVNIFTSSIAALLST